MRLLHDLRIIIEVGIMDYGTSMVQLWCYGICLRRNDDIVLIIIDKSDKALEAL